MNEQQTPNGAAGVVSTLLTWGLRLLDTTINEEKRDLLTFDQVIEYKEQRKKELPSIASSVVMITRQAGGFRVEQVFKSSSGHFLFRDEEKQDIHGRVLIARSLNSELASMIEGKDKVTFTI